MPLEINGVEVDTVHLDGVEVDELYLNGVNVFTAFTGNNFLVGAGAGKHDFFTGLATSDSGGDFFTVGAIRGSDNLEEATVVKWNSLGEVVWSKKFSNTSMSVNESRFWSCSLLGNYLYCGGYVMMSGVVRLLLVVIDTLTGDIRYAYRGHSGNPSQIIFIKRVDLSPYGDFIYVFGSSGGLAICSYSNTPGHYNIYSNLRTASNTIRVGDIIQDLYSASNVVTAHTSIVGKYRAGSRSQNRFTTSTHYINYWNSSTLNTYNSFGEWVVGIHTASGSSTSIHYYTVIAGITKPESVGLAMYKMGRSSVSLGSSWVRFMDPSNQPLIPRKVFDNGDSTFYMVGARMGNKGFIAKFNSVTMELIYAYSMDSGNFWDVNKLSDGRLVFVGIAQLDGIDPGYGSGDAAAFVIDETEHDGTSPITSIGGSGGVTLTPLSFNRTVVTEAPGQSTGGYSSSKSSLSGMLNISSSTSVSSVSSGEVTKTLF